VSWSNGFFSLGMSWGGGWGGSSYRPWGCCSGWYGGGYRQPVVINTGNINIGNNINVGNRTTINNRIGRNEINVDRSRTNLYNRTENRTRNADRTAALSGLQQARPATSRSNNVFADRDGNVARRAGDTWESRDGNGWQPDRTLDAVSPASRDRVATAARDRAGTVTRDSISPQARQQAASTVQSRGASLDRSFQARQRGTMREARRMPAGGGRLRR
jgi:hypothetical protein